MLHPGLREQGQRFAPSLKLVAEDIDKVPASVRGGDVARLINPTHSDLKGLQQCYSVCKREHGSICETPRNSPVLLEDSQRAEATSTVQDLTAEPSNLLLVDTEDMCITAAPTKCRYLALSYIWGQTPFLHLSKSNRDLLQRKDALLTEKLPRTFQDAIGVTQLLGERYLWIDALCIVQDDDVNKEKEILQMDKIFLSAALTIVSADGQDVETGLSGFRDGSRASAQVVEDIGGLRFVLMSPPLSILMEELKWPTRGWTFQESLLSKRLLVFTPFQVYYLCNLSSFSEDYHSVKVEAHAGSVSETMPPDLSRYRRKIQNHPLYSISPRHCLGERRDLRIAQYWFSYSSLVEDVSPRDLTHESDILRSLTGILRVITDPQVEKYICGLPSTILEWALLWQPRGPLRRRSCSCKGYPFPSWSWVGWVGPMQMVHYEVHPAKIFPTTEWLFCTPESSSERFESPYSGREAQRIPDYTSEHFHRDLFPYYPDVTHAWTGTPIQPTKWVNLNQALDILRIDNQYFQSDTSSYIDRVRRNQSAVDTLHPLIESGVLSFITDSSTFTIDGAPTPYTYHGFPDKTTGSFRITYGNCWVGTINLGKENAASLLRTHVSAEFIVLSQTYTSFEHPMEGNHGQNTFDTNLFQQLDLPRQKRVLYNVMWIRWRDGIAFRVGVGQIHVDAWKASNPVRKRIRLG
jgi:hypothetical protein